jgi:hypothetical protein
VSESAFPDWVGRFFSEGNGWNLQKIMESGYPPEVQVHLEAMVRPALQDRAPAVMPRLKVDRQLMFYVVSDERRELVELTDVLGAYLGSVRTRIDPEIHVEATDEIEESLLARWPHGFVSIDIPRELNSQRSDVYRVFERINVALARYAERPPSAGVVRRPIGRILCDFFVACDRLDGVAASELLQELQSTGVMSARNLLSLELQTLATRGEWRAITSHPKLESIFGRRIPGRVTEVLLDALGHTEIRSAEPADHQLDVLSQRLENVGALFMRSPGLAVEGNQNRWKVWALGAVALSYGRALEVLPAEAVGISWVTKLRHWGGLGQDAPPEREAGTDLDVPRNIEGAAQLLKRSLDLDPKEGAAIYNALCEFPSSVLDDIGIHRALGSVWRALQEDFAPQGGVDSWLTWIESLTGPGEERISVETLSEACRQWERSGWNEQGINELLLNLPDSGHTQSFREGIPVLRSWLADRSVKASASLITTMLLVLAIDKVHSAQDLGLLADLIGDLTDVAHTREQYSDAAFAAVDIWNRTKSVRTFYRGLDVMDVLLDSVCADPAARLGYWTALQAFCLAEWHRLSTEQQLLVREAAQAFTGSSEQFPTTTLSRGFDTSIQKVDPGSKRLGIYTLTEGAGRRAKVVLGELFPNLDIQLNHDKSATSSLINLAKTADYFIFSAQSAAHQAFYPVVQRRDDILYPTGKGSSSIVTCFLDALKS